ncbi:MAG: hypothetical protein GY945_06000 [Rhodobacteraceae bacterium]|nr:hypothetical protein [Paracoccaceae bacterium]
MIGQLPPFQLQTPASLASFTRWGWPGLLFCGLGNWFILGKDQIELIEALLIRAKPMAVMARRLVLEVLNQHSLRLDPSRRNRINTARFGKVFGSHAEVFQYC